MTLTMKTILGAGVLELKVNVTETKRTWLNIRAL